MIALTIALSIGLLEGQSQIPSPTSGPSREQQEDNSASDAKKTAQQEASAQPDAPTVNQSPAQRDDGNAREQSRQTQSEPSEKWWREPATISAIAALISAFAAVVIVFVYIGQWRTMNDQVRHMREGLAVTKQAADAASDSARTARDSLHMVERAYVIMSQSGFSFKQVPPNLIQPITEIKIANTGRTPARITDIRITEGISSSPLPNDPPYGKESIEQSETLVTAGDFFVLTLHLDVMAIDNWNLIQQGKTSYYFVGYVDYIDRFGNRHRSGYARMYDSKQGTLVLIRKPGYNYDRPRQKGDGNDWDETQE